jgi:polyprenyl P-hydroxybenzoate/phenylacrylic acid decarboxylase-like protein
VSGAVNEAMRAHGPRRLVVGMSGSSAPQIGIALLEVLRGHDDIETHLVISEGARRSIELEARMDPDQVRELATQSYDARDLAAPISSGSFLTDGMLVVPCSMRSLAAIATGNSADLLTRAADVTLKERRRLVLVTRETPLNLIHIRNMETVTLAGATVFPPMLAFYHQPRTIDDLLSHIVGKILDQFGVEHKLFDRWGSGS